MSIVIVNRLSSDKKLSKIVWYLTVIETIHKLTDLHTQIFSRGNGEYHHVIQLNMKRMRAYPRFIENQNLSFVAIEL